MTATGDARGDGTSEVADTAHAGASGAGLWTWAVTWGVLARPGFVVEHVEAFDADEALVLGALRRPDLVRPEVAFLVGPRSPSPAEPPRQPRRPPRRA